MRPRKKTESGQTAEEWLRTFLRDGERLAVDVLAGALTEGFSTPTMNRAKARIGAGSGMRDRQWYWYLTAGPQASQRSKVDEYGYSTETPRVIKSVNWLDVLKTITQLRDSGIDHQVITNKIMEIAYPNSGLSESAIAAALRANHIRVPNKY